MKALVALLLLLVAACPRRLSDTDRDALQDFRAVERECLAREAEILRDESVRMTHPDDLARIATDELVTPWQKMRARLALEKRTLGDELAKVLGRYLDERELAWTALAKALANQWTTPTVNHRWQYRESDEAADKDQALVAAKLARLKLPPLPARPEPALVELVPPPVVTTPGAVYFLANRSVLRLDDEGFRIIATDVDTMDVLPDGRMWACSVWHVAYFDGTRTTDYKPALPSDICAAAPNGDLWVLQDRYYSSTHDLLGRFDRKRWTIVPTEIGAPDDKTEAIVVDAEGRLYAHSRASSGGEHVYLLDGTWRALALEHAGERPPIDNLVRGGDGRVWVTYAIEGGHRSGIATVIARLSTTGTERLVVPDAVIFPDDVRPFVDAAGLVTVLHPRTSALLQGDQKRTLPLPAPRRYLAGPVAIDGAGRIWIDLADGINVIEREGKRTVYPRGSIDGLVGNIAVIAVTGAGPRLAAPRGAPTRTIKGQIRGAGKVELAMCADPYAGECPPGLPTWKTYSDAEGAFTFEDVPRWKMSIYGLTGISGEKAWRSIDATCCAHGDDLGEVSFTPGPIY